MIKCLDYRICDEEFCCIECPDMAMCSNCCTEIKKDCPYGKVMDVEMEKECINAIQSFNVL